jgi:hypothetical protein
MFSVNSRLYQLVKIGLARAGCPRELSASVANNLLRSAIVIAKNEARLGFVAATSYCPSGVVVAGAITRSRLLDAGIVRSWAYVEAGALEINADDEIGCNELMEKLRQLINKKVVGPAQSSSISREYPWIIEVYPFENYFIYSYAGKKYRQSFSLDAVRRDVALVGSEQQVYEKFVTAGESKEEMPYSDTGARKGPYTKGNLQSFTTGGSKSELVTSTIRTWANVNAAVSAYLTYLRGQNRKPMVPAFDPARIAVTPAYQAMMARGIDAYDFAEWTAAQAGDKAGKAVGGRFSLSCGA